MKGPAPGACAEPFRGVAGAVAAATGPGGARQLTIYSSAEEVIHRTPSFWHDYVLSRINNEFAKLYLFRASIGAGFEIWRDGATYEQEFERGRPVSAWNSSAFLSNSAGIWSKKYGRCAATACM